MMLTKDGITVEVTHPADVARYKKLGYVPEVKEKSVVTPEPVAPEQPEPTQQEKDQAKVEKALQPTKKDKGKS